MSLIRVWVVLISLGLQAESLSHAQIGLPLVREVANTLPSIPPFSYGSHPPPRFEHFLHQVTTFHRWSWFSSSE